MVCVPFAPPVAVSIRAPARGATTERQTIARNREFRSALPRGERRLAIASDLVGNQFRSALPRGERRRICPHDHVLVQVSIRAPARGATPRPVLRHLPTPSFDPRSRAGSDRRHIRRLVMRTFRSALPRGERQGFTKSAKAAGVFRSALPRGERRHILSRPVALGVFRSALPRGERRKSLPGFCNQARFDPRSRAGSDSMPSRVARSGEKFRSALPRGERRLVAATVVVRLLFRSALPRGERPVNRGTRTGSRLFRSALPRGERPTRSSSPCGNASFDPRSRAGSDGQRSEARERVAVSIRAPARGATTRTIGLNSYQDVSIRAPARGATEAYCANEVSEP